MELICEEEGGCTSAILENSLVLKMASFIGSYYIVYNNNNKKNFVQKLTT